MTNIFVLNTDHNNIYNYKDTVQRCSTPQTTLVYLRILLVYKYIIIIGVSMGREKFVNYFFL